MIFQFSLYLIENLRKTIKSVYLYNKEKTETIPQHKDLSHLVRYVTIIFVYNKSLQQSEAKINDYCFHLIICLLPI